MRGRPSPGRAVTSRSMRSSAPGAPVPRGHAPGPDRLVPNAGSDLVEVPVLGDVAVVVQQPGERGEVRLPGHVRGEPNAGDLVDDDGDGDAVGEVSLRGRDAPRPVRPALPQAGREVSLVVEAVQQPVRVAQQQVLNLPDPSRRGRNGAAAATRCAAWSAASPGTCDTSSVSWGPELRLRVTLSTAS